MNPQILAQAGLPAEDVDVATALSAALATLLMGLWVNYPFALAPGMGINAYFAFGVVLMVRRVPSALLVGIGTVTAAAWFRG